MSATGETHYSFTAKAKIKYMKYTLLPHLTGRMLFNFCIFMSHFGASVVNMLLCAELMESFSGWSRCFCIPLIAFCFMPSSCLPSPAKFRSVRGIKCLGQISRCEMRQLEMCLGQASYARIQEFHIISARSENTSDVTNSAKCRLQYLADA